MPAPDAQPAEPGSRRRRRRSPAVWAAAFGAVLLVVLAVCYVQRGPIGTRLALDYLEARGVPATIRIERLGPGGFAGSAVLGRPSDPDLTIEHMEVEFEPFPLVRQGLFAPRIRKVRLVRPRLKATWREGRLSFGTLQRVVDEFLAQPAVGPAPSVIIEGGSAHVLTPAGEVHVAGDATLDRGRINKVDARMGRHRLAAQGFRAELTAATLQLRGHGDRLSARLIAAAPALARDGAAAQAVKADLMADLPYSGTNDLLTGRFGLRGTLEAGALSQGAAGVRGASLAVALSGDARGLAERLSLTGGGTLGLTAASLQGAASAQGVRLAASARGFSLSRLRGRTEFATGLDLTGSLAALTTAAASLRSVELRGESARFEGALDANRLTLTAAPSLTLAAEALAAGQARGRRLSLALSSESATVASDTEGWRATGLIETRAALTRLTVGDLALSAASLQGRGQGYMGTAGSRFSWRGSARTRPATSAADARAMAATLAAISPDPAALARALRTARLEIPDLRIDGVGDSLRVGLGAPARLVGEGALVTVSPRSGQLVATASPAGVTGALRVTTSGAALPAINLDLPHYALGRSGLNAEARVQLAGLNLGMVRGLRAEAGGALSPAGGGLAFRARDCAVVAADSVVGEDGPLAIDLRARVCPDAGRPLFASGARGWAAHARVDDAHFLSPRAEIAMVDTTARVDLAGGPAGLRAGAVRIGATTLVDRAKETRFRSVFASGDATLRGGDAWAGALTLADAEEKRRLGAVTFTHAMTTARGSADIDAGALVFAKDGLQPMDISPIAIGMIGDAAGPASFTGHVSWGPDGVTSSGRAATTGLDFDSSLGRVTGLRGAVVFTSLAPMTTEADQSVTVDHVDWLVPLDDAALRLSLTPTEIKVTRAEVGLGGGRAVLDPLDLKLGELLPTSGTLRLKGIDINNLLSNFDIADKVSIEAVVDGVLPFAFTPEGLRFADGKLFATGPGRLSIKRAALSGLSASEDGTTAPPNAMQSFAYQALENLAFTQLDAGVNSQPKGRLGILFHINGRHDPPTKMSARIGILDLIRGRAFEKDIPLPSGTPVELTLDTSLNFDELMAAYSQAGRSSAVQP